MGYSENRQHRIFVVTKEGGGRVKLLARSSLEAGAKFI